jgi:DUF4097 and DUF4098 domain-containing protein YvlB
MKHILLVLMAAAVLPAGDSQAFKEDFHQSLAMQAGGKLSIENFNGSIQVSGWDQNTIDISGTKYGETEVLKNSIKVDIQAAGGVARIKTIRPDGSHGNVGVKYVVKVPRRTELENILSSNGSITVEEIEGAAKLTTSNGAIRVTKLNGVLTATTSNGAIHTKDLLGVSTVKTSNGAIHLEMTDTPKSDVKATTSNGSITVKMPAHANARLKASTSNAMIKSDFPMAGVAEERPKKVDSMIGGGGPVLELTTSNGAIHIQKM